ncbi:lysylphosphatidylglycerol synthase domain-containing protein [Yeosuana marina]|uniref:lysylphosphatidylglycerol synthase domain-containing protein n=1 Tax=Yeosuana marina TaxID=1565536 RepID=UPI0030EDC4D5|tara:strand:+ start:2690 stop:3658 length:969 start_codon:yes stop_codon:yes gene_type:complete
MASRLTYKSKQLFFVLIKISLVVAAFYFIYKKLTKNSDLNFYDFLLFLSKNNSFSLKNITFLIILSILNWFFEILKWQELVSFIQKISFKRALEQSLGSLTASLFTPNRIGEYGAKAIYFKRPLRKRILLINLLSNLLQMGITTILGIIGLLFFYRSYNINLSINSLIIITSISVFTLVLIVFLFRKNNFGLKGFPLGKIKQFIIYYPRNKLVLATLFSLLRYLIFSFQFYYLLTLFGIDISYLNAMMVITSMYLLASIIPSLVVFDVVIKGSIAVYLFSFLGVEELISLSVVTLMWILNFVLPSIIGSYYVLIFNFTKNNN